MTRFLLALCMLCFCATRAGAQTADEWIARGNAAADAGKHADAIAGYMHAIATDSTQRRELSARIGRQYLWSDQAPLASPWLAEFLAHHDDCDVTDDYGLALAWSNHWTDARRTYDDVIKRCASERNTARLREAAVFRWMDRPSRAAALYRNVQADGDAKDQRAAATGLAFTALQQDDNRAARDMFERIPGDTEARGGTAVALYRLGDPAGALVALADADSLPAGLRELREQITTAHIARATPSTSALRDADGTTRSQLSARWDIGTGERARTGLDVSIWRLSKDAQRLNATSIFAFHERRTSNTFSFHATAGATALSNGWRPATGEVDAIITPGDRIRIDASSARLIVADNVAAIANRLTGSFASTGIDLRVSSGTTVSTSGDYTAWSSDNARTRARVSVRHQLEGIPRLTLEAPVVVQWFNRPFPFALYSPRRYVEAGAAAGMYMRMQKHWQVNARVGTGAQSEAGQSWRPMGNVQLGIWRDEETVWAPNLKLQWTNSSLGSPGSFRRTSLALSMRHRL